MGKVKDVVSNLVQMLDSGVEEAKSLVGIMDELQSYLEEESTAIICESLDRLLDTIRTEAAKITSGAVVVLISPEGRVSVGNTYSDEDSDSWLKRLKSQDFSILRLGSFSSFIKSLKFEVAAGNWVPIIEFLRANAKIERPFVYPGVSPAREGEQPREPSTLSQWKLSDFLPARFPHPPLPRGLFKDKPGGR